MLGGQGNRPRGAENLAVERCFNRCIHTDLLDIYGRRATPVLTLHLTRPARVWKPPERWNSTATGYQLALEAQNLANGGFLVVASILGKQDYTPGGPPPEGPGHIAVIMPANLTQADLTEI